MKITMGKKLTLIVSTMLAITLVLSTALLYSNSKMRDSYDQAVDNAARNIMLAGRLDAVGGDLSTATLGYMMFTMTQAPDRAAASRRAFGEDMASLEKTLAEIRALVDDDECRRLASETETGLSNWKAMFADLTAAVSANRLDEAMRI